MSLARQKLTRRELYELVWQRPLKHLAKEFGISDVALGKKCRKYKIPLPGPGYWRRKETGHKDKKIPLPRFKGPDEICFYHYTDRSVEEENLDKPKPEYVLFEKEPANKIEVPILLKAPHPLVKIAQKRIKPYRSEKRIDELLYPRRACLPILVTATTLDRAFRIMDTLIKALPKRNMSVESLEDGGRTENVVRVGEEKVFIELYEVVKSEQTEETWPDGRYKRRNVVTGRLGIYVSSSGYYGYKKRWRDRKNTPLEDQLNAVIVGLHEAAKVEKKRRMEEEERERQRREREKKYHKLRSLLYDEERKMDQLELRISNWKKAKEFREYVTEAKTELGDENGEVNPSSELGEWLAWILKKADELDPLTKSTPSLKEQIRELGYYC